MSGNDGSTPCSQPNTSVGSGGHFFHRGLQQSTGFNPLLSSQGQSIYNGMYGTQTGYAAQNSFSTAGFNNYGHIETSWVSDTRVSTSVSSSVQQLETNRTNRSHYMDKNMSCNTQSLSHTCCGNRLSITENVNMCSPLSAEAFRNVNKDLTNLQSKNNIANSLDSQGWFCGQGMLGYGSQQSQNLQQSSYKCNEQYPSCSVSQINMLLQDQSDLKHPTDTNLTNNCFENAQNNQNSSGNKTIDHCSNNSSVKSTCMDQGKEQGMKYCNLQKFSQVGQPGDHMTLPVQQKHQEQSGYAGHNALYGGTGDLHDDSLYSQASLILHMGNDVSHNAGRFQPSFMNSKHNIPQSNLGDISKSYTISPVLQNFQEHGRCSLDQGLTCDVVESCLQSDMKSVNENATNLQNSGSSSNSCCHLSMEPSNSVSLENNQPIFGGPLQTQRDSISCLPNCNMVNDGMQMCSSTTASQQLQIDCAKDESSSVAGESDIIVEETEEEMSGSEISIEEIKGTVFQEDSARCLVCSTSVSSQTPENQFVQMRGDSPLTSASHIPVVTKLAQVVADNETPILKLNNEFICRRCFNLIDTVDCLETKLAAAKQDLIQLFETRLISLKVLENWKVSNNIVEKNVEGSGTDLDLSKNSSELVSTNANTSENENQKSSENEKLSDENMICQVSDDFHKKELKVDENKHDLENVKIVSTESSVENATNSELTDTKYKCEVCSKSFSSSEYLNKHHQQQHTKQFSFYCDRCGKGFTFKRALENHLLLHSGEFRYQCEICGKLFIQRYTLDDHLRKHQGHYRLKCKYCEKGFMCQNTLQIHMRTHTGERPFVCQHCGKRFNFSSNLITHIRVCSGDLPFSCSQCDKSFALETQLKTHVLSKHEGQYRFKCTICGKGFTKDSDRKVHARSHSKEKPHKCTVCGKCYSSLGNLNQHARQHSGERPFKCVICGQGFMRRSILASHMNLHTGARPYSCDQCNKTFVAKRNLHAHRKWHAGTIKRYTCTVCGKTFNHGLQVHMRTHSGVKPYSCSDCGMAFTVRSTLNKHIKSKHQKVLQFEKQS